MELFYNHKAHDNLTEIEFDKFESGHILKSKRKKSGDEILFTNGKGDLFKGLIQKSKPKVKSTCSLVETYPVSEKKITLAIGFIRPNRLDFLIEKITELGIHKIILLSSQNSNYYTNNTERWTKIARQAIKQSLQYHLPSIETLDNFDQLLNLSKEYDGKFLAEQHAETSISEIEFNRFKNTIYLIGPEGGFTENEIKSANKYGFNSIKLGNYRLRAETAALVFGAIISTNIN